MSAPAASASSSSSSVSRSSGSDALSQPLRKRPRGDDDAEEKQQGASAAQDAPAASRVQLYRHALESIFSCLDIGGLATALAVCRDWQTAVGSMRSAGLWFNADQRQLLFLISSHLRRHVTKILFEESYPLTPELLALLHYRLPHLLRLHTETFSIGSGAIALLWPQHLVEMSLNQLDVAVVDANALLRSIGQLSRMRDLCLELHHHASLSFAPLTSLPQLRILLIDWRDNPYALLSDVQVEEFRSLSELDEFSVPMDAASMVHLLRLPHSLQWRCMPMVFNADDVGCALLLSLSCLTELHVNDAACTSFDWLLRMQSLTQLVVGLSDGHPSPDAATHSLTCALQHCPRITSLDLHARYMPITFEQLTACLPGMLALRTLSISQVCVPSLAFLAVPSLAMSLHELRLYHLRHPKPQLAELHHLHGLQSLRELTLYKALATPLNDDTRASFTPPSQLLPRLEKFYHVDDDEQEADEVGAEEDDAEDDDVEEDDAEA